ncbi:unnamed protein product [Moneuplotes crassus]|uniref:Uncharacterized protein n=1 Tax=Euplotes crassus TaxID=5936 RepID=A0AAD1XZQ3_EUPCR|nr:unnamed protein product [Moneuplotes crassus]
MSLAYMEKRYQAIKNKEHELNYTFNPVSKKRSASSTYLTGSKRLKRHPYFEEIKKDYTTDAKTWSSYMSYEKPAEDPYGEVRYERNDYKTISMFKSHRKRPRSRLNNFYKVAENLHNSYSKKRMTKKKHEEVFGWKKRVYINPKFRNQNISFKNWKINGSVKKRSPTAYGNFNI